MEFQFRHKLAARALAQGDALAALNALASDNEAHSRALRGIALAQIEEFDAAQIELRAAAQAFAGAPIFRARALAALAEIAAARREVGKALEDLLLSANQLNELGDSRNATWVRLVRVRLLLLIGAIAEARAELLLASEQPARDKVMVGAFALARTAASARTLSDEDVLQILEHALGELSEADHKLISAELRSHHHALTVPVAEIRLLGETYPATSSDLAQLYRGNSTPPLKEWSQTERTSNLIVDNIAKRIVHVGDDPIELASRPVLFALLGELARSWPDSTSTNHLIQTVFEGIPDDDSYRDRCRVEINRLRKLLPASVSIKAGSNQWTLCVSNHSKVVSVELIHEESSLEILLADGHAWATRDLALALGASVRSVQRALSELARDGKVRATGRARNQRWNSNSAETPSLGIATQMFLAGLLDPRDSVSNPIQTEQ